MWFVEIILLSMVYKKYYFPVVGMFDQVVKSIDWTA